MSSLIYPTLPGLTFNTIRAPKWKSRVQTAISGKQSAIADQVYPLVQFTLLYDDSSGGGLRDTGAPGFTGTSEIKALVGFFDQMMGRYDTFLFTDPEFNAVTAQQFGTGDGTTELFAITAVYGNPSGAGAPELIQNFNGTPNLYSNGTLINPSTYTLGPSVSPAVAAGYVLFAGAPASGAVLTWTGSFYYRCRFDEDSYEWTKNMLAIWSLKRISFTSVLL
jgi:uncharacterized protein (TIGR02217 family)